MKPRNWRVSGRDRRIAVEAAQGYLLVTTKDVAHWKRELEVVGKVCVEAWHDDLPDEDREWAAAHREKFGPWVNRSPRDGVDRSASAGSAECRHGMPDSELEAPWAMLLEALRSAFFAYWESTREERARKGKDVEVDAATRLERTYLWRALTSDERADIDRPGLLRAFRRGIRRGRLGRPRLLSRPIHRMADAPPSWFFVLRGKYLRGPAAERDQALQALPSPHDRDEWLAQKQAVRDLYASAWRDDLPEEDREWAETFRLCCTEDVNRRLRDAVAQSAREAYLRSSDGVPPAEPSRAFSFLGKGLWCAFVDRVDDAPEDESELATAEAAAREYWDSVYQEAPPWDSDPTQAHWLSAVRAARRALQTWPSPEALELEKITPSRLITVAAPLLQGWPPPDAPEK